MKRPLPLTTQILIGMGLGLIIGSLINNFAIHYSFVATYLVNGVFYVSGALFINALKMLVVPLVTFSLIEGVNAIGDAGAVGRIGCKTIFWYLLTTAFAVSMALVIAAIMSPGQNFETVVNPTSFTPPSAPSLNEVLINLIPGNPVKAFADGEMLQIICFALFFGIAMLKTGDTGKKLAGYVSMVNKVMMSLVSLVMRFAPLGVFCLMAKTFSEQGLTLIMPMLGYALTVIACLLLHSIVTLNLLLYINTRLSPWIFLRKMRPVYLFAFSTASSNATLPVTLRTVEKKLGVHTGTASFTIPLGATFNMDGTAIMQGVATVFIANVYHIPLTLEQYVTVIGMSLLASIGTAGVPGVGLIMLAMVLNQVGLPVEGIGLIIGIDRLLDMMRTVVNVNGDAVVTCIVSGSEKTLDKKIFQNTDLNAE
jgi:Na+/H+-dicarboxylate symporter